MFLTPVMHILLSRTDSIGDMVLTLPLAGIIKNVMPEAQVIMLASAYTLPVVALSEHIDDVLVWQELERLQPEERREYLHLLEIDVCVHVFPRRAVAETLRDAGVRQRIGTINRLYHWWTCNEFVRLSRKNSALHEAELNTMLLKPLLSTFPQKDIPIPASEIPQYYGCTRVPPLPERLKEVLDSTKFNLVLHPKSQGSAPEWSEERWCELLEFLPTILPSNTVNYILTGTEREGAQIPHLRSRAAEYGMTDLMGKTTLDELIALIHAAHGLIASSTGPLHIAAALGKHTLGLFAPHRPMHAGRWRPLGTKAQTLSLETPCQKCKGSTDCACINALTAQQIVHVVQKWCGV